jgi:hypothetical protein
MNYEFLITICLSVPTIIIALRYLQFPSVRSIILVCTMLFFSMYDQSFEYERSIISEGAIDYFSINDKSFKYVRFVLDCTIGISACVIFISGFMICYFNLFVKSFQYVG